MRRRSREPGSFLRRTSMALDDVVGVISPRWAMMRKSYRFGYDILDRHRTRKKRTLRRGPGDQHLTEANLDELREICRDLGRNNPLVKGIYRKLATNIVGTATKIQARTEDKGWNTAAEQLWKEEMVDMPCDVTGRFNFHAFLKLMYYTYLRDGDMFVVFTNEGVQAIEGEQVGTPYDRKKDDRFDVINGVVRIKKTMKVDGYYIGKPNRWGYIESEKREYLEADDVNHVFNPERFSCSRGEPILVSAVDYIDKLKDYIDAELIAAKINACFPMMVTMKDPSSKPAPYTGGVSPSGRDEDEQPLEKIVPGTMMYAGLGEKIEAIGATRPISAFDSFITNIMKLIGQSINLPLMLVTGDYSGATFMNSRIAYQEAQQEWIDEQELIIKPFVRRLYKLKLQQWIERKALTERKDSGRFDILCKRWPYVDPFKEAKADEVQLRNGTTNRSIICARQGRDFNDVIDKRAEDDKYTEEKGVVLFPPKTEKPAA